MLLDIDLFGGKVKICLSKENIIIRNFEGWLARSARTHRRRIGSKNEVRVFLDLEDLMKNRKEKSIPIYFQTKRLAPWL